MKPPTKPKEPEKLLHAEVEAVRIERKLVQHGVPEKTARKLSASTIRGKRIP